MLWSVGLKPHSMQKGFACIRAATTVAIATMLGNLTTNSAILQQLIDCNRISCSAVATRIMQMRLFIPVLVARCNSRPQSNFDQAEVD